MFSWLITRIRYPYVMMHLTGDSKTNTLACGGEAFYLRVRPGYRDPASSRIVGHLDGTPMEYGADLVCESCGGPVQLRSMDVYERGWWSP